MSIDHDVFARPPASARPKVTWWWPGAAVADDELRAELADLAEAGFGGARLVEFPASGLPKEGNPAETRMWGTPHYVARLRTAYESAREHGLTLDTQVSTGWPWSSPVAADDSSLAVHGLTFAVEHVAGPATFAARPPAPDPADAGASRRLVGVTAARRSGTDANGTPVLDSRSAVDLTTAVDADGEIAWDVPDGEWVLFGFWSQPTGADAWGNATGLLIDPLSLEATTAALGYLAAHVYDPLGDLPAVAGELLHEDSLEGFDTPLLWTPTLLAEFRRRRGYDLARYLPALSVLPATDESVVPGGRGGLWPVAYDFEHPVGQRVRRDYAQTITELWVDHHIRPAKAWAMARGRGRAGSPRPKPIPTSPAASARVHPGAADLAPPAAPRRLLRPRRARPAVG